MIHRTQRLGLVAAAALLLLLVAATTVFSLAPQSGHGRLGASTYSLRFYGHGTGGIDRVRIAIDNPERPADVGAADFTLEFWIKARAGDNTGTVSCGSADGWITGNIVVDRDIYFAGDYGDFGLSLGGGKVAFGVAVGSSGTTLCGQRTVADGAWHHVAVVRRLNGDLRLFVDGVPDGSAAGPAGDASYRNGRSTSYANDPYLVLGAEKHDAGSAYPSFRGWLDDLRISQGVRYSGAFTPPTEPLAPDNQTLALYRFDEGPSGPCQGTVLDSSGADGGPSNGTCAYGGGGTAGPVYTTDTPFSSVAPTRTPTRTPRPTAPPATLATLTFLPQIGR